MRTRAVAACLLLPVFPLFGQSPAAPATIIAIERLRMIGDSIAAGPARTAQLGRGSGYTYALTHRDSSGTVEAHMDWTDVFVIQAGQAALVTGGVAEGAREATTGEWRGGTIRGGTRAPIKSGDMVVVPAGTAHQMVLAPGERITYLALKIAAGAK